MLSRSGESFPCGNLRACASSASSVPSRSFLANATWARAMRFISSGSIWLPPAVAVALAPAAGPTAGTARGPAPVAVAAVVLVPGSAARSVAAPASATAVAAPVRSAATATVLVEGPATLGTMIAAWGFDTATWTAYAAVPTVTPPSANAATSAPTVAFPTTTAVAALPAAIASAAPLEGQALDERGVGAAAAHEVFGAGRVGGAVRGGVGVVHGLLHLRPQQRSVVPHGVAGDGEQPGQLRGGGVAGRELLVSDEVDVLGEVFSLRAGDAEAAQDAPHAAEGPAVQLGEGLGGTRDGHAARRIAHHAEDL
jgi:hypothetical protein